MTCCCAQWIGGIAKDHAGMLVGIARREGLVAQEALDVVQDALYGLLANKTEWKAASREDLSRVLGTRVRNAARNLRRRHYRAKAHEEVELVSEVPAPDVALEAVEMQEQLATCMSALSDVHRHVIVLRVLEELTGAEAAEKLGMTPGHVAVLLHRAREALAACMSAA